MTTSTSFRISAEARAKLAARAVADGVSSTSLLERLIIEQIDALDFPGVIHRGAPGDRRAALAAGPDVWEVVGRLRELSGTESARVDTLAAESALHPTLIRLALDYAAAHPDEVNARIRRNEEAAARSEEAARTRAALLA